MKKIYDQNLINKKIEQYQIKHYFNNQYPFVLMEYEKGETIVSPLQETDYFHFVLEGTISIYFIDREGKQTMVCQDGKLGILGDLEFVDDTKPMFFAEAKTNILTLALSLQECKDKLNQDIPFLHLILESISEKLKQSSSSQFIHSTVEERLMAYLNYYGEINHIGQLAISFHCSRRQIQRVLKTYLDQGIIVKEKKGVYKLVEKQLINI